jgi:hypothetical protein
MKKNRQSATADAVFVVSLARQGFVLWICLAVLSRAAGLTGIFYSQALSDGITLLISLAFLKGSGIFREDSCVSARPWYRRDADVSHGPLRCRRRASVRISQQKAGLETVSRALTIYGVQNIWMLQG